MYDAVRWGSGMKPGKFAEVSRVFNVTDLHDYTALSGHQLTGQQIPEPLIGAMFSFLLGVKLPGLGTMYLKQETRFLNVAQLGDVLIARVEITRFRPEKRLVNLSTGCRVSDGPIIATGNALVYVGDVIST